MNEKNKTGEKVWDAKRVRLLRMKLGWSQAEMSRKIGVSISDITHWEQGAQVPSFDHINSLQMLDNQAESYSENVQRRPIADLLMHTLNLQQISDESCREIVFSGEARANLSVVEQRKLRDHVQTKKRSQESE